MEAAMSRRTRPHFCKGEFLTLKLLLLYCHRAAMAAQCLLFIYYNADPEEKQGAAETECCFSGSVSSARETVPPLIIPTASSSESIMAQPPAAFLKYPIDS